MLDKTKTQYTPNPLDKIKILTALQPETRQTLSQLECLDCVDSTNNYLLKRIDLQHPKVIACFAEQQTAGKGRRGRQWLSPHGHNIYHSLLYYFNPSSSVLLGLNITTAVFVARALKRFGIQQGITLKWPNDILWNNQKLGGILIETQSRQQMPYAIVIGIGINTRLTTQNSLPHPIISTEEILGKPSDRNTLAAILLDSLLSGLWQLQQTDSLDPLIKEWYGMAAYRGQWVKLSSPQQTITGRIQGLSDSGALLLIDEKGEEAAYLTGELSLRLWEPHKTHSN